MMSCASLISAAATAALANRVAELEARWALTSIGSCRLTCLAPDIAEAILDGRQPKGLRPSEMLGANPSRWDEQRARLGRSVGSQPGRCLSHHIPVRGEAPRVLKGLS
jgi:hypothetical protein